MKRIPAYILKLAMIYACFEKTAPAITEDQVVAAIEVEMYSVRCAEALMGRQRQHSVEGRCKTAILKVLEKESLPVWRIHQRIESRFTAKKVSRALRALLATGAIQEVGKTPRGEPIYRLRGRRRD